MAITDAEYQYLMKMPKEFVLSDDILLDASWSRDLVAPRTKQMFIIHYKLSSLVIEKFTYHKTYRKSIPLLRFDSCGRHTNPDGTMFDGPHVHIYKEGYRDKFAYPVDIIGVDTESFTQSDVLEKFLQHCNVLRPPIIKPTLF